MTRLVYHAIGSLLLLGIVLSPFALAAVLFAMLGVSCDGGCR